METDFEGTIARVAQTGYTEVEFAGYFNHTPSQVHEILARGNGSDRQLRVWNANRDIVEVVREISAATEAGVLSEAPEALQ